MRYLKHVYILFFSIFSEVLVWSQTSIISINTVSIPSLYTIIFVVMLILLIITVISIIILRKHQKKMENELIRTRKVALDNQKMESLGRLAGGIAHDFNNQLMGIISFSELLEDVENDPSKVDKIERIIISAQRCANLTRDLLSFSQQGNYKLKPIDLHKVLKLTENVIHHTIPHHTEIIEDYQADPSIITADQEQVQNLMLNILTNSCESMPNGGLITIETLNDKSLNYIIVKISDTGRGIPKEIQDSIFDPYFTTKKIGEGSGMGLAAAYGITKKLNGKIKITSDGENGTLTEIMLPLSNRNEQHQYYMSSDCDLLLNRKRSLSGTTVAIIVKEKEISELMATVLEQMDYSPHTFSSLAFAKKYLDRKKENVRMVILDKDLCNMGKCNKVKELIEAIPEAMFMLFAEKELSGETKLNMRESGISGHLRKPFNLKEFNITINKMLLEDIESYTI